MENVDLADYVHYMVCDEKVIACGLEGGDVVVFDISTHQQLYNHSPEIADTYPPQMDLGDDYIIVVYNRMVKILEKMSGSLQYQGTPLSSRDIYGIKMIGNVGIAGDQKGNICVIEKESETSEKWTEKIQSSGIKEITHIEGVDNILVIGSRTVIQMWDWKNQKLVNSTNQIKSKVWMLQYVPPHIFVVGGEDWKGFKVIDINTGKLLRHFKIGDFPFHNVHVNERFIIFCELRPFFGEKDKIEVMIFDMHQLIDEKIEDKDLWHKCYQFIPNFSQVNAVSINTKMIVSYRCTATIYDFWKAEDCEEVSDLSTNSKLVIFPNADYSDSDDNDFEYHPQIILNHDFDNHPQIVLDNDNQNESENEMGEDENNETMILIMMKTDKIHFLIFPKTDNLYMNLIGNV